MKILTKKAVAALTTKQIVEKYNELAKSVDKTSVKKFRDRATAETRLLALHKEVRAKVQKVVKEAKTDITKNARTRKNRGEVGSIKSTTLTLISEGQEDDKIVSIVKEKFPESKFDFSHVSWYRSTLFRDGIIGPEHAPRRSKAYKNWKQKSI